MMQEPLKKHPDEDMNPIIRFLAESSLMILLIMAGFISGNITIGGNGEIIFRLLTLL